MLSPNGGCFRLVTLVHEFMHVLGMLNFPSFFFSITVSAAKSIETSIFICKFHIKYIFIWIFCIVWNINLKILVGQMKAEIVNFSKLIIIAFAIA